MKNQKPTYEQIMEKSNANSWWKYVPEFLKEISNTIAFFKKILNNNESFNSSDLPILRKIYKELRDISESNKKQENFSGVGAEKALVRSMQDIINSRYSETKITVGTQKRITKVIKPYVPGWDAPAANTPGHITSYYYKYGKIPEFATLIF